MIHRHFHTSSSCNTESPSETLLCSSCYGCVHVIPTHANSSFCVLFHHKELLGLFLSHTDQLLNPAAGLVTHSDLAELLHHTHPRRTFSPIILTIQKIYSDLGTSLIGGSHIGSRWVVTNNSTII